MASVDPEGLTTRSTYDSAGNLLTSTDAKGNVTAFEYDTMNRVTKTIDAKMEETLFSYDINGNIISVTDVRGNVTSFSYDDEDRLIKRRDPLGREERFSYDREGNLIRQINRKRESITFEYDALNRVVRKVLASDTISYAYDAIGNLSDIIDSDSALSYTYNSRNQVLSVSTSGSSSQPDIELTYSYDLNGNRTSMSTPLGDISYSYDDLNRQTELTYGHREFSFSYDEASRLIGRSYPNGVKTKYSYDKASRILSVNHRNQSNEIIGGFSYTYDKAGNRVQMNVTRPLLKLNSEIKYTYDKLNQLISATNPRPGMPMEAFTYDGVGNRLQRDGESTDSLFNANNQLTDDKTYTYRYGLNGNLIERQHKANGKVTLYDWDSENRLIQITEHPNSIVAASKQVFYRYDGLGRRIETRIRERGKEDKAIRRVYDNEDILLEYDGSNELRVSYLHGPSVDEPLSMTRAGVHYYYHQDGLNSVIMLTDASGQPAQQYTYDSFGNPFVYGNDGRELTMEIVPIENPYLFTGREYDTESGLYHYRARSFNPATGRFLSEEPLGIDGPNLYWYARNNPVNYIDPNGTFPALILVPAAYYFGVGVGATYNYFFTDVGFGQTFSEATPFSSYLDFLVPGLGFFADINTFRYFNNLFNNQRQKDIDDAYQGQNGENQPSGSPLITNCL